MKQFTFYKKCIENNVFEKNAVDHFLKISVVVLISETTFSKVLVLVADILWNNLLLSTQNFVEGSVSEKTTNDHSFEIFWSVLIRKGNFSKTQKYFL